MPISASGLGRFSLSVKVSTAGAGQKVARRQRCAQIPDHYDVNAAHRVCKSFRLVCLIRRFFLSAGALDNVPGDFLVSVRQAEHCLTGRAVHSLSGRANFLCPRKEGIRFPPNLSLMIVQEAIGFVSPRIQWLFVGHQFHPTAQ
jgi:hypothetical protein